MTRRNCDTKPPAHLPARNSSRLMALPEDPEGIYELLLELYTDGSAYNGTLSQRAHAEQAAAQVCPLLQCSHSSPSPSPRVAVPPRRRLGDTLPVSFFRAISWL